MPFCVECRNKHRQQRQIREQCNQHREPCKQAEIDGGHKSGQSKDRKAEHDRNAGVIHCTTNCRVTALDRRPVVAIHREFRIKTMDIMNRVVHADADRDGCDRNSHDIEGNT